MFWHGGWGGYCGELNQPPQTQHGRQGTWKWVKPTTELDPTGGAPRGKHNSGNMLAPATCHAWASRAWRKQLRRLPLAVHSRQARVAHVAPPAAGITMALRYTPAQTLLSADGIRRSRRPRAPHLARHPRWSPRPVTKSGNRLLGLPAFPPRRDTSDAKCPS